MSTYPSKLLKEIKGQTGWTDGRIGEEAGVSQPTINRLFNGQPDCKGNTLQKILELHNRVCNKAHLITKQ